jgi:SnoaL-like domain
MVRFAEDAVLAYWDGKGEETAPRAIARGPEAIGRVLAAGGRRREAVLTLREGRDVFVEGRLREGNAVTGTYVASLQLDGDGAVARCLCLHGPPVEPCAEPSAGPPPGAARAALDRYFQRLIAGDFDGAAACFSADCMYSHPPYRPGGPREEFRGRDGLLQGFRKRGMKPARPAIVRCVQQGADCFIEGVVEGVADGGSFVSSATLDGDGLVRRYVAFYTTSRIARA